MQFNKLLTRFFLLFLCLVGWACKSDQLSTLSENVDISPLQINILKEELQLHPNEGLVYYQGKPFTGTSVSFYADEKIAEKIDYLQGKRQGLYRKWFASGLLSFEAHYQNGKLEGSSKSWWKNGQQRSEANHSQGVVHGVQRQWYQSGQLFEELHIEHGKEEGMQKSWRENGKVYNNYEAKNGRIFGLKRANLCYELEKEVIQYKD